MMESSVDDAKSLGARTFSYFYRQLHPITTCRVAFLTDVDKLKTLIQPSVFCTTEDIEAVFHTSALGVVAMTGMEEIVACAFVNTYPNISSVPPSDWQTWIRKKYNLREANNSNTLFLHLVLYQHVYSRTFLPHILRKLFEKFLFCKFIILVVPPMVKFVDWAGGRHSTIVASRAHTPNAQYLMVYFRQHFTTTYKLRMGVSEDNDDLVSLVDDHTKRLKSIYGAYYISEIIKYDKGRHVIVAEHQGKAEAVMIFNEVVDYDLINASFQSECFYGLRKPDVNDVKPKLSEIPQTAPSSELYMDEIPNLNPKGSLIEKDNVIRYLFMIKAQRECHEISKDLNVHLENIFTGDSAFSDLTLSPMDSNRGGISTGFEETFRGVCDARFSCNVLTFTEDQLEKFRILKRRLPRTRYSTYLPGESNAEFISLPTYAGEGNAFTLEVVAASKDHEDSLIPLLKAGFELFPEKDYCVLSIPSKAPNFPMLNQVMVRVSPLPLSTFTQELYVVHRNAMSDLVTIKSSKIQDLNGVEEFLEDLRNGAQVVAQMKAACESKSFSMQSYVIKCGKKLVGVVNLRDMTNLEYIKARYQLENVTDVLVHKPGCFGEIVHFVISPIFQRHNRFLLLELHRLSDYSILFCTVYPTARSPSPYRKTALACVLADLIPVLPAKAPEYEKLDTEWKLPEQITFVEKPYAVYVSTPMYCGIPRLEIKDRIVVVGASEVGLSFLINLIFNNIPNWRTIFTNVTLVSAHGIHYHKTTRYREIMIPKTSDINDGHYLALLSLGTYVNIVEGTMTHISRKKQVISVNNSLLPYDMLFLTCGTQFQMPVKAEKETRSATIECPENVFIVNTPEDVDVAMETLKVIAQEANYLSQNVVIVYGNSIEAYCCIEGLLEANVTQLVFVKPPYSVIENTQPVFEEKDVERAIKRQMANQHIEIIEGYKFYDWTFDTCGNRIVAIKFKGDRLLTIFCMAAFMFGKKTISKLTFDAITNANLIYDGHLVIDNEFRTNDPNIYAAGAITKYPRRYYADHMRHAYFNQNEIGEKMAEVILAKLLPSVAKCSKDFLWDHCHFKRKMLVPRYHKPIYVHARVPRNLQFFYVKKPGMTAGTGIATISDDFGQLLTTGHIMNLKKQGYFKLYLNQNNTVEMILAVSREDIEVNNLHHIWGKHEALLNNLVQRFEMAMIIDLFDFFSKPWIYALYHDRYRHLNNDLNKLMTSLTDYPGTSLIEDIITKIKENNYEKVTEAQFKEMLAKLKNSTYYEEIENKVMTYLNLNATYLPMYITPGLLAQTLGAYENSPLFRKM